LSDYPVLDVASALDHTGGDRELLGQLCGVFMTECPAELQDVRAAVESGAPTPIQRTAHKLKGSTSVVGGVQASEAALRLEHAATGESPERIRACLEALQLAVAALLEQVRQLEQEIRSETGSSPS
jgi:HPt (histidine-containing phosphotransfer) domain-containing protein